jgi:hypothetical protein
MGNHILREGRKVVEGDRLVTKLSKPEFKPLIWWLSEKT